MSATKQKDCPMPTVACVNCQGADDALRCRWHYEKNFDDPVIHPGKKVEPKSRW